MGKGHNVQNGREMLYVLVGAGALVCITFGFAFVPYGFTVRILAAAVGLTALSFWRCPNTSPAVPLWSLATTVSLLLAMGFRLVGLSITELFGSRSKLLY